MILFSICNALYFMSTIIMWRLLMSKMARFFEEIEQTQATKNAIVANVEVNEIDNLIELGSKGHYPLFFNEWINESIKTDFPHITLHEAKSKVTYHITKLAKHKDLQRKKTAITALNDRERMYFIKCFLKMVEFAIIDNHRDLH